MSAAPPVTQDAALRRVVDHVATARATRTPLQLRGHGSKAFYGETPRGNVLDLAPLAGIARYEPTELVTTVRAGTPIADLESALAAHGQCLAFEPPRFEGRGTVGGMVAAALAGPSRAAVGGVRDFVLGAALLNAKGDVLRFGGEVMKNVAGYDVSRLLVGSLGILGPILEVSLKVLPTPPAWTTLRFEWPQAQALEQLQRWAGQPLPLRASAWWNDMLVVQLAGADAAVRAATQTLGGDVVDAALAERFWTGLRDQRDPFFDAAAEAVKTGATLWRVSVAPHAPPLAIAGEQLIEWHGGQRWIVNESDAPTMRALAAAAGGHAVAFRGSKAGGAFSPLPAAMQRIHRELKARFDPDRLFNPGRLYADL